MTREKYRPGMARVGEATPQSDPDLFTDAEILAEIKYLLRLNKRYGTHLLRVVAYTRLMDYLANRRATGATDQECNVEKGRADDASTQATCR